MDPYNFLRSFDDRTPFLGGLNGLDTLNTLSGLNIDLPTPVDVRGKGRIAREEAALQSLIVQKIIDGDWEYLKPNTGKAVNVGDHHICVAYNEDKESRCRVWEWHGHLLLLDDEGGFSPEYTYGNFFQPLEIQKNESYNEVNQTECDTKQTSKVAASIGLGGIIDGDDGTMQLNNNRQQSAPILHRVVRKDAVGLAKK
ncbi:hypothetical protein KP509_12G078400 [Ceratopteris richardii]|uniref:Uncharacterized protein n=1 Tax=Ceratopteris richardii TaxID=49495 RepID=A0A8T2TN12_CERRI|nr:hypothetical protein KP509_12G078400 [Ceratopteris richardii]